MLSVQWFFRIRINGYCQRIPPHALVCRSSLPEGVKRKLKEALFALDDPLIYRKINPSMTGFGPVQDRDFAPARKVIDIIESK